MTRAFIGLLAGRSQSPVDLAPAGGGDRGVRAGAEQRMGEPQQLAVLLEHPGGERGVEHVHPSQNARQPDYGRLGKRRHQPQRAPRRRRKAGQLIADQLLDIRRSQRPADESPPACHSHQLKREQRIATGNPGQLPRGRKRQRLAKPLAHKLPQLADLQRPHRKTLDAIAIKPEIRYAVGRTHRRQNTHVVLAKSRHRERQRANRLPVKPLQIVNGYHHRRAGGQ